MKQPPLLPRASCGRTASQSAGFSTKVTAQRGEGHGRARGAGARTPTPTPPHCLPHPGRRAAPPVRCNGTGRQLQRQRAEAERSCGVPIPHPGAALLSVAVCAVPRSDPSPQSCGSAYRRAAACPRAWGGGNLPNPFPCLKGGGGKRCCHMPGRCGEKVTQTDRNPSCAARGGFGLQLELQTGCGAGAARGSVRDELMRARGSAGPLSFGVGSCFAVGALGDGCSLCPSLAAEWEQGVTVWAPNS